MRVVAGIRRGKKLLEFEGDYIRPTTDRVKEAVFNLIQGRVEGGIVFDAFAGTGALGIEAVSRGAELAVATDIDERSVSVIRKNVDGCGFSDRFEIVKSSATAYLERTDRQFDLVFLDPPYNKSLVTPVLEVLKRRKLLSAGGSVIVERDGPEDVFDCVGFSVEKERKYGRTVITVLKLD